MKVLLRPKLLANVFTLVACHSCFQHVHAAVTRQEYDAVILSTRGDVPKQKIADAIQQLRTWHENDPKDMRIVFDLTALLDRIEDYQGAESLYRSVFRANGPTYAVSAVAHAALKDEHFVDAEIAYQWAIFEQPDNIELHVGLVYSWLGQGRFDDAYAYTSRYLEQHAQQGVHNNQSMWVVYAELNMQRKDWLQAASIFQNIVQSNPDFIYAKRQLIYSLKNAGVAILAKEYAERFADDLNQDERYISEYNYASLTIHYGEAQLNADEKITRVNTTDIAIGENDQLIQQFGELPKTEFDRIVALKDRGRMSDVIEIYQKLLQEQVELPPYVKFTVADAYLFLQQPEQARDLYLDGLTGYQDDDAANLLNIQISLVYAYQESGEYAQAEQLSEQLVAAQRPRVHEGMPGLDGSNPNYTQARVVQSQIQLYDDHLDNAQGQLETLRNEVPFNFDVRSGWASLLITRDHPRAALAEFDSMQVDDPVARDPQVGRGEVLLQLNDIEAAKSILPNLVAQYPDNKSVQNYSEKVDNYLKPSYSIDNEYGRGATLGGADSLTDASVYSSPWSWGSLDNLRLLGHFIYAQGETPEDQFVSRSRLGVGLNYRQQDLEVEGELDKTGGTPNTNGLSLKMNLDFSDTWHGQALVDTNVINLPAAALAENLSAKEAAVSTLWNYNESRKAGATASTLEFSDGNIRDTISAWWMERWCSDAKFKMDTTLNLSTSHNSELDRPYFNPVRDEDLNVEFKFEWTNWRRYQRSFKQQFTLTPGEYWQSGYGAGPTGAALYEHIWEFESDLALSYGIGRNFQPYNGIREYRDFVILNLSGKIK